MRQCTGARSPSIRAHAVLAVTALLLAATPAREAASSCATIPSAEGFFPSVLGSVSAPFAKPGDVLTVRRDDAVFAADPSRNGVTVRFLSPSREVTHDVAATVLAAEDGTECPLDACTGGLCRCLRLVFPDTDALVGTPGDGLTLAGPASLLVSADGSLTAVIDGLLRQGTTSQDELLPGFVALPPASVFTDLVAVPGTPVLAAADRAGNLLIPVSYESLVGAGATQTRFVEAFVPALAAASDVRVDALTARGAILPPLLRPLPDGKVVATVDAPESVLRVSGHLAAANLAPIAPGGPIVLAGVQAAADPRKRAEPTTLQSGERFAVFETRECGPFDLPATCGDLNGDGDETDTFLQALDLDAAGSDPVAVDAIDGTDFAGYPDFFPPALYTFAATDELVHFRIPEPANPFAPPPDFFDVDGDGIGPEVVRAGAFDLVRGVPVAGAEQSVRRSVDSGLLALSLPVAPGIDVLGLYDARAATPDLFTPLAFPLVRTDSFTFLLGASAVDFFAADVAAGDGFAAAVVDETLLVDDVNQDGFLADALVVVETANGAATAAIGLPGALVDSLQFAAHLLAYETIRFDLPGAPREILVYDASQRAVAAVPAPLGADSFLLGPISPSLVPYARNEAQSAGGAPEDLNGDGDAVDSVLHAYLPFHPGGPLSLNLGLALPETASFAGGGGTALAKGPIVIFPVGEAEQGRDLDADGEIGPPPPEDPANGRAILHVFNARTLSVTNYGARALVLPPLLRFVERGVAFLTATSPIDFTRRFLRDLDADGSFEEIGTDVSDEPVAGDNCPTVFNPGQEDGDGDGRGDACDPALRCAEACARPDAVLGTDGGDRLVGTAGPDVLCGLGGRDRIDGGGGDDVLCGGDDDDTVRGGDGDDFLDGGPGDDRLNGGRGDDTLLGGAGDDDVVGDRGDDFLDGGPGADRLGGRSGDDVLLGGPGDDTINGHAGADRLEGGEGDDRLGGGAGADVLVGGPGGDRLTGASGPDLIDGRDAADTVRPGGGDDVCLAGHDVAVCELD